jgi:Putative glucoamylase
MAVGATPRQPEPVRQPMRQTAALPPAAQAEPLAPADATIAQPDRAALLAGQRPERHAWIDFRGIRDAFMREKCCDYFENSRRATYVQREYAIRNPRIFAADDCCLAQAYTNTAEAAARIVVHNTLFRGRRRLSALTVPWCTYTDPQVAHVGLSVRQARA